MVVAATYNSLRSVFRKRARKSRTHARRISGSFYTAPRQSETPALIIYLFRGSLRV